MSGIIKTCSISGAETFSQDRGDRNYFDQNTLSFRLKMALRSTKFSQSELARLIKVKPQVIQYLCSKNIKTSRFSFEIAEALGVNYTWLSTGEGQMCKRRTNYVLPSALTFYETVFFNISKGEQFYESRIKDPLEEPYQQIETMGRNRAGLAA